MKNMAHSCLIYCPACGAFRSATFTDADGFLMPSPVEAAFDCDECGTAWRVEFYEVKTAEDRDRAQQREIDNRTLMELDDERVG